MPDGSIFDLDEFRPFKQAFRGRAKVFRRREAYYEGTMYRRKFQGMKGVQRLVGNRLYKGIKGLYLPLHRAVDVAAGITPGGWQYDEEEMSDAAIEAAEQVFAWSNWNTDGVLYVHYGAALGNVVLRVADLRDESRVEIDAVPPDEVMLVASGRTDRTPRMALTVRAEEDQEGEYEYAEVVEPERVRTYRDGVPWGFDGREPEYPNELQFVPFVEIQHKRVGLDIGENVFARVMTMLDEVNELASYLADVIKKHVEPQWAAFGAEPAELEKSGDNVWFFPDGSSIDAILAKLDIDGVLAFLQDVKDDMKASLPELAFDELKSKDQIATATVELQLMELVLRVKRSRPNYDDGLREALRMAGMAAQSMGQSDVAVLASEPVAFDDERSVLPMDEQTQMEIEMQRLALERERSLDITEGISDGQ